MVVLNKRQVLVIITLIVLIIIFFSIIIGKTKNKYISVVSLPVTEKTIILDAGHGLPDQGAEGIHGITEQEINLKIAKKVQNLLEQSGCNVILTRSDENGIYNSDANSIRNKKVSDIKNRVKIGNESSADIFVSIHLNKIPQSQYYGWQTFFKENNIKSEELAKSLQEELNASIQKENKRQALKIKGKYIIEHVEIPISIIECGFLSNPEEARLLKEDEYQNKIAWGIYNGIMDYFYSE